jgi:hypothetical protein
MFRHSSHWCLAAVALLGAAIACKKKSPPPAPPAEAPAAVPLSVTAVALGKQVSADKMVSQPLQTFAPRDTIYASVSTVGAAPDAMLVASWTYQTGQQVKVDTLRIAPTGPATTEFHISKPSAWPVGKYHVAITLNGAPAGAGDFEVKR